MDLIHSSASLEAMRDEEILTKSIENPRLFGVLVDRYQTPFVRKAFTIVRNEAEAEDIAQETFTKIYLHAGKFRKMEGIEFKSWAWRILVNTALTHYRKLKRSFADVAYLDEVLQNGEDAEVGLAVENNLDRDTYYREIRDAIDELPEEAARLLRAHYLEDRPYEEIAAAEGVSMGALKMKLFRARRVLKDILDKQR